MIRKTSKWVATAGFVFATFAGAQSASADVCYAGPIASTSDINGSCGLIAWTFETSLTGATLNTVNWSTRPFRHNIQIALACADEKNGSAESVDNTDQSVSAGCEDDAIVQVAEAWITTYPTGLGQGQGEGEEEPSEEGGEEEDTGEEGGEDEEGEDEDSGE